MTIGTELAMASGKMLIIAYGVGMFISLVMGIMVFFLIPRSVANKENSQKDSIKGIKNILIISSSICITISLITLFLSFIMGILGLALIRDLCMIIHMCSFVISPTLFLISVIMFWGKFSTKKGAER